MDVFGQSSQSWVTLLEVTKNRPSLFEWIYPGFKVREIVLQWDNELYITKLGVGIGELGDGSIGHSRD